MNLPDIEVLNVSDVEERHLKRFRCKEPGLETYLKEFAINYHNAGSGQSTIIFDKDNNKIIGYFTLKCSSVRVFDKEMDFEPKFISAIEISRFAIDIEYEGRGLGKAIFSFILDRIETIRNDWVGNQLIILFSLPNVTGFYQKFGFKEIDRTMSTYECRENKDCICMYKPSK